MADKPIGALPTAENIADDDNFVLEQNSTAKRMTGKTLVSFLLNRLNGRGGIKSIVKVTSTGLVDLYDINYTDGTSQRITITNGRGITGIDKVSTNGNADTYAIRYNDGTSTQFTVFNGANGKNGEDAYVWVRYASAQPSNANPSFGEVPDRWMGVYSGPNATAPKEWSAYNWYDTKGERGLSIYRVNGKNRPLYRYSYDELIMPSDHTPKVGDLVITTDGYLASVTQVFADTEQVDVESTDIRLGGDSYVELLYGDDGLTVFDAVNSGRPVYLLYEDYRLPMVTWTTDVLSATFGGCFDDKIITCKFEGAVWSANVKTIEGATDETGEDNVVIVTESTTQAELSAAYNAGKVIVLKRYQAGGYKLYYHAGNWRFFRVADGVIEEAVYNAGTWTYNTVASSGGGDIFVGDANTTLAEFKDAYDSGKTCFLRRSNPSGAVTYTAYNVTSTNAFFFAINSTGAIVYAYLDSNNLFTVQERKHVTTIDQNSTDNQIPTAKAVYDSVKGKLDATALPTAVNGALAQAKESGEFDGADGAKGDKGDTGEKGDPGKDGVNGVTPHVGSNGNWFIGDNDTGIPATGPAGGQGLPGTPGENGKDGTSAIHSWNGTVLTITSASGTSSADLKGEKGNTGEKGAPGLPGMNGTDGYTPVRGVDYYTEADKSEFSEYIASELAKRGQLKLEFANSIEECTDTGKLYILPDGYIYAYMLTEVESGPAYTNVLPTAINADKTPYVGNNGEKGYKTGWRLNSSRVEKEAADRCCTGFIPVKYTDEIRFKNIITPEVPTYNGYLFFYNSDFSNNGMAYEFEGIWDNVIIPSQIKSLVDTATNATSTTAYMRLSTAVIDETSIITINEEIVEGGTTTEYAWANTGHAFIPADYENRIIDLETQVTALEKKVDTIGSGTTTVPGETISSDEVEILIPSEAVAVVGVEFNIYHKSIIRAKRDISNYDIKIYLNNSSVVCNRYAECFRLTPASGDVGDYTCTVEVRNLKDYAVIASKSMTLHIIANTSVSGKNVLFIGDSLTFSRAGLYPAEIQYNLSNGGMVSIGTQNGSVDINQVGNVKHEGYNGATIGGFLKEKVTSAFTNPFYNPATSTFDLGYFLSNNGYSKVDAVCLNLGHNNFGNEVTGVNDLKTIIQKIHSYNADIPVIISLVPPLGDQDSSYRLSFSAGQMRFHWRQLIKAYIDAFDNGKISNVYLSTPYFNVDQDNDMPTETVARCARDSSQIIRQNDSHPTRVGTLKMADSYYANLVYYLG